MTHGNEQLINLFLLLLPKNMFYYTILLAPYTKYKKFHTTKLKNSLIIALLVNPYIFDPLHKISIFKDYNPINYDKWMWLCLELSPSFLHVCINTNSSFIWAIPLQGEATQHIITHLLTCFAIMKTPSSIKTDNGPAYISKHFNFYNHFLLNMLQVFLFFFFFRYSL